MKKAISLLLVVAMACTMGVTAFASQPQNTTTVNSQGSLGTDYVAGDNGLTNNGLDANYGEGNNKVSGSQTVGTTVNKPLGSQEAVDVYVSKAATYTVLIPKTVILSGDNGVGEYKVSVTGDIEGLKQITVQPEETVTLTQAGKDAITATIEQDVTAFITDMLADADGHTVTTDGTITANNLTAGSWTGSFTMHISYDDYVAVGTYAVNLEDNSWEEIINACQNNAVPSTWNVGDTKEMMIDGQSYTVAVIGKNHDTYADGSGVAPLTFQVIDLVGTHNMNDTNTNSGSWDDSAMYSYLNNELINSLDADIKNNIKAVTKHTFVFGVDENAVETSADKLFLLSTVEIAGDEFWAWSTDEYIPWLIEVDLADAPDEVKAEVTAMLTNTFANLKAEGKQYAYYATLGGAAKPTVEEWINSRNMNYWYNMNAAILSNSTGVASWWLRTPDTLDSSGFQTMDTSGDFYYVENAPAELGVSFGFCF